MGKFPWLFLALWGFLGVAVIYGFDSVVDYKVHVISSKIREEASDFLYNVSKQKWSLEEENDPPSWLSLLPSVPWVLSAIIFVLVNLAFPKMSIVANGIISISLVVGSSIMASWICSYWFNVAYIMIALVFLAILVSRTFLKEKLIFFGFDATVALIISIWGVLASTFIGYLFSKFTIRSDAGFRLLVRSNAIEMVLVGVWMIVLSWALIVVPLFKLKKQQENVAT